MVQEYRYLILLFFLRKDNQSSYQIHRFCLTHQLIFNIFYKYNEFHGDLILYIFLTGLISYKTF